MANFKKEIVAENRSADTDSGMDSGEQSYEYPEAPEELKAGRRGNWLKLLAYFGPGAIVASATLGSGEVLFAPRGGAIFGFAILWTLVWAGLVKGIVAYSGIRYYTLTGEHVASRWAKLPGPRGWFPLLMGVIAIAAFPAWIAGYGEFLGQIVTWSFGFPQNSTNFAIVGTILILVTAALTILGGYDLVERAQVLIVAFLSAAILVLTVSSLPSPLSIIGGLIPTFPGSYPSFVVENYPTITDRPVWVEIVTYMGAVGGGVYDYIGYVGYAKRRGWGMLGRSDHAEVEEFVRELESGTAVPIDTSEENQARGLAWLKAPQIDVLVAFVAITFFTAAAMILGAKSLHPAQLVPADFQLFQYQAQWFADIHPSLTVLWQVGVFFAIFGSLYAVWEGYTWTWLESFKPFSARIRRLERDRLSLARTITVVYAGGIALILLWSDLSAVAIITPASLLGGVFGCGLWCWAMLWAEKTALPPEWQGGWKLDLALVIAGLFLTIAGFVSIVQFFGIGL
jgi:Mn2+/Fe2+ NRAMP family transporter